MFVSKYIICDVVVCINKTKNKVYKIIKRTFKNIPTENTDIQFHFFLIGFFEPDIDKELRFCCKEEDFEFLTGFVWKLAV